MNYCMRCDFPIIDGVCDCINRNLLPEAARESEESSRPAPGSETPFKSEPSVNEGVPAVGSGRKYRLDDVSDETLIAHALSYTANCTETGNGTVSNEDLRALKIPREKIICESDQYYVSRLRRIAAKFKGWGGGSLTVSTVRKSPNDQSSPTESA